MINKSLHEAFKPRLLALKRSIIDYRDYGTQLKNQNAFLSLELN